MTDDRYDVERFVVAQDAHGTCQMYAITSLDQARAYLHHPVLGPRLLECISLLDATADRTAEAILGNLDATKLQSSLTLFMRADPADSAFLRALNRYFDGVPDAATNRILPPEVDAGD